MNLELEYSVLLDKYSQLAQNINNILVRLDEVESRSEENEKNLSTLNKDVQSSKKKSSKKLEKAIAYQEEKEEEQYKVTDELTAKNRSIQNHLDNVNSRLAYLDKEYNNLEKVIKFRTREIGDSQSGTYSNQYELANYRCGCGKCNKLSHPSFAVPFKEGPANKACQCGKCNQPSNLQGIFENPIDTTRTKVHECKICGEKFSVKWILENHLQQHQSQKQYPCTKCGKVFFLKWRMKKHMVMHQDDKNTRKCHFFNNNKWCPIEEKGCIYFLIDVGIIETVKCQ